MSSRRLLLLTLALTGCGFELRRAPELRFATLQLSGFPAKSPLAVEIKRQVDASATTKVIDDKARAQVVLEAIDDVRNITVVASTSFGQVREVQLRSRLKFRLHTPAGRELLAPTEILQKRDMNYNETDALAKEQEEALLYRSMTSDIAQQVVRRLAAVRDL